MVMAASASASFSISTKPKPFERPIILSMMIVADVTVPAFENASRSSSSVVEYGNPPTNNFLAIERFLLLKREGDLLFASSPHFRCGYLKLRETLTRRGSIHDRKQMSMGYNSLI